ncbi:MAG: diguanylate cyclase domain-containing protein [Burkholderiaceae bacterium]
MQESKHRPVRTRPTLTPWHPALGMGNGADGNTSPIVFTAAITLKAEPWCTEDWDMLFSAVITRLRRSAAPSQAAPGNDAAQAAQQLQAAAMECAQALEQLHQNALCELRQAQQRHQQLLELHAEFAKSQMDSAQAQIELAQVQTALAQVRSELLDSEATHQRAGHQAMHDRLTALPNRKLFQTRLNSMLGSGPPHGDPLTVMYLELDGFKPINDAYGPDVGAELLKIVAARLSGVVGSHGMVSRLGGDEFACLLAAQHSRQQLTEWVGKLFDTVSAPLKIGKLQHSVKTTIGIASAPADGHSGELLLKNAQAAMHRAKRRQLGHAFFDLKDDV